MAHPSTGYVRYLIAKGVSDSNLELRDVQYVLRKYSLPGICKEEFDDIRTSMATPYFVEFYNRKHKATTDFMKSVGLYSIWNPSAEEANVFTILKCNAAVADTLRILLLGHIPDADICALIQKKHHVSTTVTAVQMYRKYFWDVDNVSQSEWYWMLQGDPRMTHYLAVVYGDQNQAYYRAGFNPKVDSKRALKNLLRTLSMHVDATKPMPMGEELANILSKLSKEMVLVHQAVYGDGANYEDNLRQFQIWRTETEDPKIQGIRDIAPFGNYSNSGFLLTDGKGNKGGKRDADA